MLKNRLKDMDLKITELADYLQVSRPTLYKFIEYYDDQNYDLINRKVLRLFNYITENELAGKKNVVNFILNNLVEIKELEGNEEQKVFKSIRKYIISNPKSKKIQFFEISIKTDMFDDIIYYLTDLYSLMIKDDLTDEERNLIDKFQKIKNHINSNN
ncbi:MAG: hypothetical protein K2M44_07140 [Clostridia bacterium]|nr:hypothetical protein [Clostridia bacterium]